VAAKVELPPPRSFRGRLYEEKTKGNRWYAAELNTTRRRRAGVLKGTHLWALIVGICIFGPGEMMCRDKVEEMVVPKRSVRWTIF
jgi:hypothetical protein